MFCRTCGFPPDEVIRALKFPEFLTWCTFDEVRSEFLQGYKDTDGSFYKDANGNDLDSPYKLFDATHENSSPGWKCIYSSTTNLDQSIRNRYSSDCNNYNPADVNLKYPSCGVVEGSTTPFIWKQYSDKPSGDTAPFKLSIQYTITEKQTVKPNVFASIGAALGWVSVIELAATMFFGVSLIGTGIAKAKQGKKASVLNLLKGAGLESVIEEHIEQIAGMAQPMADAKVAPA